MDAVVQVDRSRRDERIEREYRNQADSFARGSHGAGGGDTRGSYYGRCARPRARWM
jgi:hypothetical protein